MKTGKTLSQLAAEIERQRDAKRDFVAPARNLHMTATKELPPSLRIGEGIQVGVGDIAHQQIAEFAGIPKAYYSKMQAEAPELLATNVNEWFQRTGASRMVRTLDNKARALLSDRYRPLDNDQLVEAVLPALMEANLEIVSCEVTERRLYIKAIDPKTQRFVPNGFRIGDGSHQAFRVPSGEICPAIQISNSEIGAGTLSVVGGALDSGCTNLMWRWRDAGMKKYHIGGKADIGEQLYAILSPETRRVTDQAVWLQVRDTVKHALSPEAFTAYAETLAEAAQDRIDEKVDPAKVVEVTAKKFGLSDGQRVSVLQHLIRGGDLSKFGLANAVTSAANEQEDYDAATDLEALGGKIIELPKTEWAVIKEARNVKEKIAA